MVEDEYVRAVQGGTGFTKCGGNYAGSIIGQVKAENMDALRYCGWMAVKENM